MTFDDAWPAIDSIGGFYERDEMYLLWNAVRSIPATDGPINVAEVGCEKGRSTSCILMALEGRPHKMYVVDPFLDHPDEPIEQMFFENIVWATEDGADVDLVRKKTENLDPADIPKQLHFVHVDGCHLFNEVQKDCRYFAPRVVVGGMMAFHDYGRASLPGVKQAVDRSMFDLAGWRWMGLVGTCLILERAA